jgi:hypothetical protein
MLIRYPQEGGNHIKIMRIKKPDEFGNANVICEVSYPLIKLTLLRYEAIAEFFADEPYLIHINPEKDTEKITCEKILSLYIDVPNRYMMTYNIFSNEREDFSHDWYTVLRKVIWDKENDQGQIKNNPDHRDVYLNAWPNISIKNVVMTKNDVLKEVIDDLDRIIENGIILSPRKDEYPFWKDIAVMRKYNWGQVHNRWGASHQNIGIEACFFELLRKMEQMFIDKQPIFHKIALDYQILPDAFHKSLIGE